MQPKQQNDEKTTATIHKFVDMQCVRLKEHFSRGSHTNFTKISK